MEAAGLPAGRHLAWQRRQGACGAIRSGNPSSHRKRSRQNTMNLSHRETPMPWLQLKAHIAPEPAETLEELLLAEGATAITLQDAHDDPVFEPERGTTPPWPETFLTGS